MNRSSAAQHGGKITAGDDSRLGGLYVIVGQSTTRRCIEMAREALAGGADVIQLRSKAKEPAELLPLAHTLRRLTAAAGRRLIINDSLELALESRADGVHLGPKDLPVDEARRVCKDKCLLVGASVGNVRDARKAQADGADYLGVGPVYPTTSKDDTRPVLGLSALSEICRAVDIPVFGVGGIDFRRASGVMSAGAAGVAVISAINQAHYVQLTARALKELCRK